jgi:hypothetical protein
MFSEIFLQTIKKMNQKKTSRQNVKKSVSIHRHFHRQAHFSRRKCKQKILEKNENQSILFEDLFVLLLGSKIIKI